MKLRPQPFAFLSLLPQCVHTHFFNSPNALNRFWNESTRVLTTKSSPTRPLLSLSTNLPIYPLEGQRTGPSVLKTKLTVTVRTKARFSTFVCSQYFFFSNV